MQRQSQQDRDREHQHLQIARRAIPEAGDVLPSGGHGNLIGRRRDGTFQNRLGRFLLRRFGRGGDDIHYRFGVQRLQMGCRTHRFGPQRLRQVRRLG